MPTNLYGPGDNFDLENSHVLPALIRKFHEAKEAGQDEVVVWGTGTPRREFLHVDDMADACVFLMQHYSDEPHRQCRRGRGHHHPRAGRDGADGRRVRRADRESTPRKPDGTPRKLLDVSRLHALGWKAKIPLRAGIEGTYRWYLEHLAEARR